MKIGRHAVVWLLPLLLAVPMIAPASAQPVPPATSAPAPAAGPAPGTVATTAINPDLNHYNKEQLGQMLAPIALYPDQLVAQILMASTFPDQIVAANVWLQNPSNAALKGDALVQALQSMNWDPSVKSITAFPQIVKLLSDNMGMTQALGQAFATQQDDVWAQVQLLRRQAEKAGNLKSDNHIVVTNDGPNIVIAPADPAILTVPYYNPAVVYGPWLYPAYPPVFFPPVYWGIGPLAVGVGWGWGPAWPIYGPLWGWYGVHWGFGGGVFINRGLYARISFGHVGWRGGGHWVHRGYVHRGYVHRGFRGGPGHGGFRPHTVHGGPRPGFRGPPHHFAGGHPGGGHPGGRPGGGHPGGGHHHI